MSQVSGGPGERRGGTDMLINSHVLADEEGEERLIISASEKSSMTNAAASVRCC